MTEDVHDIDTVVIGAGIVGLAAARAFARAGHAVMILEKNASFGEETSSRNSEVIHAGIFYAEGSLKARSCVAGKHRLYEFCAARGVDHRRTGKLVIATEEREIAGLERTERLARAAGVDDLDWLDEGQVARLEPALTGVAGLLSPSTGIVDSHGFMLALLGDAEAHGAELVTGAPIVRGSVLPDGRIELVAGDDAAPVRLRARHVINCAGLWAQDVARRIEGLDPATVPEEVFVERGEEAPALGPEPE